MGLTNTPTLKSGQVQVVVQQPEGVQVAVAPPGPTPARDASWRRGHSTTTTAWEASDQRTQLWRRLWRGGARRQDARVTVSITVAYKEVVYCTHNETKAIWATMYVWLRSSTTVYSYECNKPCQLESRLVVLCTHVPFNHKLSRHYTGVYSWFNQDGRRWTKVSARTTEWPSSVASGEWQQKT